MPVTLFGSVLLEILVVVVLVTAGESLALSASSPPPQNPRLIPCLEFEGTPPVPSQASTTDGADCPLFDPGFCGGRVCRKCYRDDYEIGAWERLSSLERGFALEDAADRARQAAGSEPRADFAPAVELERMAAAWMSLAGRETTAKPEPAPAVPKGSRDGACDVGAGDVLGRQTPSISLTSPVGISAAKGSHQGGNILATADSGSTRVALPTKKAVAGNESPSGGNPTTEVAPEPSGGEGVLTAMPHGLPPPTPCTRICRYNRDCYGGKVCIGCFRETHEIASWSGMSPAEKKCSLEDAADRSRDLSGRPGASPPRYGGGIAEDELRRQAVLWGALDETSL